jgi:uncharacterized membrane protein YkvA (DUF1232 family)
MKFLQHWKTSARNIKQQVTILFLAYKDSRVSIYAKLFIACIVLYAISPIDIIPDFIPILGYLDDLILLPLGILLAFRMIPKNVLDECREKVKREGYMMKKSWKGAILIVGIWILSVLLVFYLFWLR